MQEDKGNTSSKPLFTLGFLVATPAALTALENAGQPQAELLRRHVLGDWGEIDEEDKRENELSVREGFRILSSYARATGTKVWIITEANRSSTTILLPEEY